MRLAFFGPLPPSRSGIADYSEALLEQMPETAEVEIFDAAPEGFDPARYDCCLYQLGNNEFHEGAYEAALRFPGVGVLHEANLHHLMAGLTIRRNDWDGYLREVEFDSGPDALAYAHRVRALEVGPDYVGVPMLRRVLGRLRGVIVHSDYVARIVREKGFTGPIARIPHGAWIPDADRNRWRSRLGLDESSPLVGTFGFLKPYKRIAESLRAFRRLLRVEPRAKMLLAGEVHPDLPLDSLLRTLDLSPSVRVIGYTPPEEFTGYLAASDIVLNLRYPTVGETSGTVLRAMGLGRPVFVTDIGSFAELPDEICCKIPVDAGEEDLIFEYLKLLVSRPEVGRTLGDRARRWVERNCSWQKVAVEYLSFLKSVANDEPWRQPELEPPDGPEVEPPKEPLVQSSYLAGWNPEESGAREYLETHLARLRKTLDIIPRGGPSDRILEMGAYLQLTPSLHYKLGYGEVRGCYYGPAGQKDHKQVTSAEGETFACDVDLFDAEKDPFPYPDEHFTTVLCGELIEHLASDPMHLMSEVNRILVPGGHFILTTPNIGSLRAIGAILLGYHPGFFPAYIKPVEEGGETDSRHNREYTPKEVARLLIDSGFEITLLETGEFRDEPHPEHAWVEHLLDRYDLPADLRGDGIYSVGRKTGPVKVRYPDWLYS